MRRRLAGMTGLLHQWRLPKAGECELDDFEFAGLLRDRRLVLVPPVA